MYICIILMVVFRHVCFVIFRNLLCPESMLYLVSYIDLDCVYVTTVEDPHLFNLSCLKANHG